MDLHEKTQGACRKLKDGTDVAVLTIGPIGNDAAQAIAEVEAETGMSIAHYDTDRRKRSVNISITAATEPASISTKS